MNDIKICKLDGCERRVLSKLKLFCGYTCSSIASYQRGNKKVSDERLKALKSKYSVNHLQINSSPAAYKEAMKLNK